MNQPSLRILCIIYDREPLYLQAPPEAELPGHEITVVHDYASAKRMIMDKARGIPPFDIVLTDVSVPGGDHGDGFESFPYCPIMLQPYLDVQLVRGLGIFVPPYFETHFQTTNGYAAMVASRDCFTPLNTRDWRKLFELVIRAVNEMPQ
ncbi:MAG: hypothetical protein V4481_00575 [Patescibacteria group bacterium]